MVPCILVENDWTDLRDQERRPHLEEENCQVELFIFQSKINLDEP